MATKPRKQEKLYSVNALSKETGRDRRTLDKVLIDVAPAGADGARKLYRLSDVEAALANRPGKSLRDEKLTEEIRKLRIHNAAELGDLIGDAAEAAWLYAIAKKAAQVLWQKLANEMPAAVARLDEGAARAYGKRIYNAVMTELRNAVKDPATRRLLATSDDQDPQS